MHVLIKTRVWHHRTSITSQCFHILGISKILAVIYKSNYQIIPTRVRQGDSEQTTNLKFSSKDVIMSNMSHANDIKMYRLKD